MKKQILIILLNAGLIFGCVNAENKNEIGEPYFDQSSSEGRVDSMVLAPTGERVYTLKDGVLYQYALNPLRKINSMKVNFDSHQTKNELYKIFISNNENRIILYSKVRLRLLDMKSSKIVKTISFKSELGVLNNDEFLTLDNNNKGTVWSANQLIKKKEFVATGGARWSDKKHYDISFGNLIKAGEYIILYRQPGYVNGEVFVFDSKSYHQIWRIQHKDDLLSSISYDLNTLYIKHAKVSMWHLGKHINRLDEYRKEHKNGYLGDILKINLSAAKWSHLSKKDFNRSLNISLSRVTADQQISPLRKYYILGYSGRYGFLYHEEKITRAKNFLQFKGGEAALFGHKTNYFQITANARKYLKMKNSQDQVVSINDATFKKYNKVSINHKDW